ncbi:aldo/keto reductase [Rhodococcus chondri]|uniref:Aldo/keto reductase n=1 Tax=Rhodococcus chondri TaxID=3065941 RepID=A0ABU7JY51_9NOCA|nr:aldo/keto reductase [Rhodococcus sp. CC-R104]MEE2034825.1 aldo/keto reductase [Rhodococcus sp. CC-R104]
MATIGNSELDIFPIALGGNTFGWTADEATSFEILDAFRAAGGNFIDSADSYSAFAPGNSGGESETILGNWADARGVRDEVTIATKVGHHPRYQGLSPANVKAAADASLKRLQSDHIDLYYAHSDDPATPLVDTVAAFDELVRDGKVRYVGLSNFAPARVAEWLEVAAANGFAAPVSLQPHYNLVHRVEYENAYAPLALEHSLGVLPYYALAAGFLTGKYRSQDDLTGRIRERMAMRYFTGAGLAVVDALSEIATAHAVEISTVALAWLSARPGVVAPLASVSRIEQLPALLDATRLVLTDLEYERLTSLSNAIEA